MSNVKHIQNAVVLARECNRLALYYLREGNVIAAAHYRELRHNHMADARHLRALDAS